MCLGTVNIGFESILGTEFNLFCKFSWEVGAFGIGN